MFDDILLNNITTLKTGFEIKDMQKQFPECGDTHSGVYVPFMLFIWCFSEYVSARFHQVVHSRRGS